MEQQVYTINELATMLGLSRQTVIRLFENESGIILIERPETMHKKRHRTIRVPRAVYQRVLHKITT